MNMICFESDNTRKRNIAIHQSRSAPDLMSPVRILRNVSIVVKDAIHSEVSSRDKPFRLSLAPSSVFPRTSPGYWIERLARRSCYFNWTGHRILVAPKSSFRTDILKSSAPEYLVTAHEYRMSTKRIAPFFDGVTHWLGPVFIMTGRQENRCSTRQHV